MGWKNVKEYYRIDHQVEVTDEGICIGSPYVHAIIVISLDGVLVKEDDRTMNEKLSRYQAEMKDDPVKLRELVVSADTFAASVPVYTYQGADVIQKQCEQLGWPNVTHDGAMMYENTFFPNRDDAFKAAQSNCEASIFLRRMEISGQQERMANSNKRLQELLYIARKLGLPVPSEPSLETSLEKIDDEIARVVQSVNEWDDRTSPDDYPEHLLITSEELADILRKFAASVTVSEGRGDV